MKTVSIIALVAVSFLCGGCAGLTTAWVLHMEYQTPDARPVVPDPKPAEKKPLSIRDKIQL